MKDDPVIQKTFEIEKINHRRYSWHQNKLKGLRSKTSVFPFLSSL